MFSPSVLCSSSPSHPIFFFIQIVGALLGTYISAGVLYKMTKSPAPEVKEVPVVAAATTPAATGSAQDRFLGNWEKTDKNVEDFASWVTKDGNAERWAASWDKK
jgi:hypothetical protein